MVVERCQKVRAVMVVSLEVSNSTGPAPSCLARRAPERKKERVVVAALEVDTKVRKTKVPGLEPKVL